MPLLLGVLLGGLAVGGTGGFLLGVKTNDVLKLVAVAVVVLWAMGGLRVGRA